MPSTTTLQKWTLWLAPTHFQLILESTLSCCKISGWWHWPLCYCITQAAFHDAFFIKSCTVNDISITCSDSVSWNVSWQIRGFHLEISWSRSKIFVDDGCPWFILHTKIGLLWARAKWFLCISWCHFFIVSEASLHKHVFSLSKKMGHKTNRSCIKKWMCLCYANCF